VAAFADRHFVVDADADGTVGASSVRPVDGEQRIAELARMLGGTDGNVARAHAADLLSAARSSGGPGPRRRRSR
jgi:DNA repair protein RecN (Recombination protein N)